MTDYAGCVVNALIIAVTLIWVAIGAGILAAIAVRTFGMFM